MIADGGALRSLELPRVSGPVGAHEANLQVGWLAGQQDDAPHTPVFMDSWHGGQPISVLYVVRDGARQHISRTFDSASASDLRALMRNALLTDKLDRRFSLLEDRERWSQGDLAPYSHTVDTAPRGGTLVLFDSVAVPHEVTPCLQRERLSIAGWFHEAQQPFPEFNAAQE